MSIFSKKPIEKCPDPFANKVKCETCKCWLDRDDASRVKIFLDGHYDYRVYFYCPIHKKPYNEKYVFSIIDLPTQ